MVGGRAVLIYRLRCPVYGVPPSLTALMARVSEDITGALLIALRGAILARLHYLGPADLLLLIMEAQDVRLR